MQHIFFELVKNCAAKYGFIYEGNEEKLSARYVLATNHVQFNYLETIEAIAIQIPIAPKMSPPNERVYEKLLELNYAFAYKEGITFTLDKDYICLQKQVPLKGLIDEVLSALLYRLFELIADKLHPVYTFMLNNAQSQEEQTLTTKFMVMNMVQV